MQRSKSPAPDELFEKESKILAYLSHARLHHRFTLPATDGHEELQVAYAVIGVGADQLCDPNVRGNRRGSKTAEIPTIIWCGAMFATRWQAAYNHHLAEQMGVRVVYVDRPGIGGSDSVQLNQRIAVWLETVEHLVRILDVGHVVLACHSAGTLYLMNSIYHHRDLLSPKRPYIAFFGPWVSPTISGVALLSAAKMLPSSLISQFASINTFVAQKIMPSFSFSAGALSAVSNIIPSFSSSSKEPGPEELKVRKKQAECYGMDKDELAFLEKHGMKFVMTEGVKGVNEEALLCLKKTTTGTEGKPASWGPAEDFETFVKELADRERTRRRDSLPQQGGDDGDDDVVAQKLKIDAFFGETDYMIGKKGDEYFRSCWDHEEYRDAFEFEGTMIEKSNHDSVSECWRGGIEKLFREAKWSLLGQ